MLALAIIGGAFIAWFVLAMLFTPVVSDIQGVVAETWLECRGEILTGPETYKPHERAGDVAAFAIKSSPADRSTASRVLFQTLVRSGESIGPDFDALFPARRSVPTHASVWRDAAWTSRSSCRGRAPTIDPSSTTTR